MREKDKVNDEREREKKNEREWKVSCFLFLFDNKGHFRKIKCFISFFSICRLSLGVGFQYETYEDLLLIFGPSWAQNTILPKKKTYGSWQLMRGGLEGNFGILIIFTI